MAGMTRRIAAITVLFSALAGSSAQAQTETVVLNTGALSGLGTFYLELTLTDGSQSGDGNSRAMISNIVLNGVQLGSILPPTTGDASGNLNSGLILVDDGRSVVGSTPSASGLADFAQGFTVTSRAATVSFDLTLAATSVEPFVPDAFDVAVLDNSQNDLATNGPDGFEFALANFTTTSPMAQGYTSTSAAYTPPIRTVITPAVVPEPSPWVGFGLGGLILGGLALRARRAIPGSL